MITSLDDPSSCDPLRVGGKAADLAQARAAGAAVLPGFVVEGEASRAHMALGAETLPVRGSGGARLVVTAEPISFAASLVAAGEQLGHMLAARSSTPLESSGEWSGAFTSYLDVAPEDLPKAVTGCWASAFSVAALQRQEAAGVEPGSFPMSVLVQPALTSIAGGWAKVTPDGIVVVRGVKGAPAPLLQGWVAGSEATHDGSWNGDELTELIGLDHLESIRDILVDHAARVDADTCEWALTDRIWALQFAKTSPSDAIGTPRRDMAAGLGDLVDFARVTVLAPGPLGEQLILPWALGGIPDVDISEESYGDATVPEIRHLSRTLTAQVWGMPAMSARRALEALLDQLSSGDVQQAIDVLRGLGTPDRASASRLLGKIRSVRNELAAREVVTDERAAWQLDLGSVERALSGERVKTAMRAGVGRWEPLAAAVILDGGRVHSGTPASPGIGAGLRAHNSRPHRSSESTRGVITAPHPIPALAPLLWDAAGIVTSTGSPAAHLFEAARSLRVPAVCGVDLGNPSREIVAVDGHAGTVATLPLEWKV